MPVLERELKLYVPVARQAAIKHALKRRHATAISLHAMYFDTARRDLALAGIALRLRLEGAQWMQTLKMPGPDEQSRIELNHERPEPTLDLSVYADSPAGHVLDQLGEPLLQRYETRVERLVLRDTSRDGTVELAYDTGLIKAGDLSLPVSELELEYVAGKITRLFDLGKQWLEKYGLIMDLRSKAERGDALADLAPRAEPLGQATTGERCKPDHAMRALTASLRKARRAGQVALDEDMSIAQAYLACANDCLNQIVRNSAYLAGVDHVRPDGAQQVGYTHQARVGMRRLRSCWRFFARWLDMDSTDERALERPLRPAFEAFGKARDLDVIRQDIAPRLEQAGMPALRDADTPDTDHAAQAIAMAEHPAHQGHLLELSRHLFTVAERHAGRSLKKGKKRGGNGKSLRRLIAKKLNGWLKNIAEQGQQFSHLRCEQQHDLRKKIKRLRYATEFCAALLDEPVFTRLLPALHAAQDILGDMNDLHTARAYYETRVADQPQAWFALGWLTATQAGLQDRAQRVFDELAASVRG